MVKVVKLVLVVEMVSVVKVAGVVEVVRLVGSVTVDRVVISQNDKHSEKNMVYSSFELFPQVNFNRTRSWSPVEAGYRPRVAQPAPRDRLNNQENNLERGSMIKEISTTYQS